MSTGVEQDLDAAKDFYYNHYVRAFVDKDPERYADQFALPCLIRAEELPRAAFFEREELVVHVTEMIDRAKETTWARSTIDRFDIRLLEPGVAKVTVDASRYDADDRVIARLYADYTLNTVDGQWKMAAIFGGFSSPAA